MRNLQRSSFPEYSPVISAEQNLEEFPFFELKSRKRGTKARVFEITVRGEDGISLNRMWKVMPSGEYGAPGPVDQDVYLAVLQLLQQRGGMSENGEVSFSLYELRKTLGWSDDSGGAYREIRDALLRIATTSVQSKNAFYSAEERRRIVDTFNVWSVHFAEYEVGGQTVRERHVLRFHPVFIRNYAAQYLKGLDTDLYWSLRSPVSKRLYRLVDLQRSGGLLWQTDLLSVRDQVPLDYSYPSQIKRALHKAHGELVDQGFLSGVEYEGKTGVMYRVSRDFARRQKARELSGDSKEIFAIERLIREGIDGDTARELVVSHGPDRCLFYAEAVNAQKGVRGRSGWIITAVREGWVVQGAVQDTLQSSLAEGTNDRAFPPQLGWRARRPTRTGRARPGRPTTVGRGFGGPRRRDTKPCLAGLVRGHRPRGPRGAHLDPRRPQSLRRGVHRGPLQRTHRALPRAEVLGARETTPQGLRG